MKTILALCLFVGITVCAQAQDASFEELQKIASDVTASLRENPAKRGVKPYSMPAFQVVVTHTTELNAHAVWEAHAVVLPAPIVEFLRRDIGELAFVIAHEIGHLQDANCPMHAVEQHLSGAAASRMCEANADSIGIQYLMAAGYSPFDAAAFMGRFMLVQPTQANVSGIILGRFLSDHPVDVDRIRNIGQSVHMVCETRPELCQR